MKASYLKPLLPLRDIVIFPSMVVPLFVGREKSIKALQMLNAVGYAQPETDLKLDLVYNPAGAFLPTNQQVYPFSALAVVLITLLPA